MAFFARSRLFRPVVRRCRHRFEHSGRGADGRGVASDHRGTLSRASLARR
jgi:hypothetical protein